VQDSPQLERENIGDNFPRRLLPGVKHRAILADIRPFKPYSLNPSTIFHIF